MILAFQSSSSFDLALPNLDFYPCRFPVSFLVFSFLIIVSLVFAAQVFSELLFSKLSDLIGFFNNDMGADLSLVSLMVWLSFFEFRAFKGQIRNIK
jgi:hypothetical protein